MTKTISALVTVWNGSSYLQQTLNSISEQSFVKKNPEAFEVIIADDASTDNSVQIIRRWESEQNFKVVVIEGAFNKGVWANLNAAYAASDGEYIAQISHDDLWQPSFLDCLLEVMRKNPSASTAFARVEYINEKGVSISSHHFRHESIVECDRYTLLTELVKRNLFCGSSALIRNSFFSSSFWGVSNEMLQDYEAWLNLLVEGEFLYVPTTSVSYRLHQNNLSGGIVSHTQHHYERISLLYRVFLSQRFKDFYCAIENNARYKFLCALDKSFLSLSQRVKDVNYLHGELLDQLQFVEVIHDDKLLALRAEVAMRLGMGRKYQQLRCLLRDPQIINKNLLPPLVPYGSLAKTDIPARLERAGIGRLAVREEVGKGFLLLATEEYDSDNSLIAKVAKQKRIIMWGGDVTSPIEQGYAFALDNKLENEEIMRFWQHCEKEQLMVALPLNQVQYPFWMILARAIYRKIGKVVPGRLRSKLVFLAHRVIDRT